MFKEILLHLNSALLASAHVDSGVEVTQKLKGPYDFNKKYEHSHPWHEDTIGAEALRISATYGRIENVEYLLGQGVRITKEISFASSAIREDPKILEKIQHLLGGSKNGSLV